LRLVHTQVVFEDGKVYFLKHCPEHGQSKALVSEDAHYYQTAFQYIRPGSIPLRFSTETNRGCPDDCGLCPAHQQHTCLPIIEITDHCNLACPICMVDNRNSRNMPPEEFRGIIDRLVASEGRLETVALSGGEPTLHPQFRELVDIASRPEIGRVSVVTNGIRLASSPELCEMLKEKNVYVNLQIDGLADAASATLRGKALTEVKQKALDHLAEYDIPTQIVFLAARGVNEGELGNVVRMLTERQHVLSLLIQPAAFTGRGGASFPHDPLDRLTIPGVIKAIEEQTSGLIRRDDFIPLPCSHPLCVSLTYLLRLDDGGHAPFPRFVDMRNYLSLFQQTATLEPNEQTEASLREAINNLWSTAGEIPDSERIIKALKRSLLEMFPNKPLSRQETLRIAERQAKTIFIHHFMDRYDFDLERAMKCCHHYPQADGRIMPVCTFNAFHRGAAKG
jgi:hypothetical protein